MGLISLVFAAFMLYAGATSSACSLFSQHMGIITFFGMGGPALPDLLHAGIRSSAIFFTAATSPSQGHQRIADMGS